MSGWPNSRPGRRFRRLRRLVRRSTRPQLRLTPLLRSRLLLPPTLIHQANAMPPAPLKPGVAEHNLVPERHIVADPNQPPAASTAEPSKKTTQEVADDLQSGGNVSSAQLDQEEIDHIADELRKGLKAPAKTDLELEPQPAVLPVEPAPADAAAKPGPAKEGTVRFQAQPNTEKSAPDDTIFIDADGQLRITEEAEDKAA